MLEVIVLNIRSFGLEVADVVSEIPGVTVAGLAFNEAAEPPPAVLEGYPVWALEDLQSLASSHMAVSGFGTVHRRRFVDQVDRLGMPFFTAIHPFSRVSSRTTVETGCVIFPGVVIGAYSRLERQVLVNRNASVGHHTRIGEFCSLGPGAVIGGHCDIGDSTYIGMGAVVRNTVRIGRGCVVAAGAVVTGDIPDHVQVMGCPARVTREGVNGL